MQHGTAVIELRTTSVCLIHTIESLTKTSKTCSNKVCAQVKQQCNPYLNPNDVGKQRTVLLGRRPLRAARSQREDTGQNLQRPTILQYRAERQECELWGRPRSDCH